MSAIAASIGTDSEELRAPLPEGPVRPGTNAHKVLFCRTLLDTFDPYKPAVIDWPALDTAARDRLVSLPIWDIAVQTEGRARLNVASYAARVRDPLLRRAVELNAFEEGRHKHVLSNLVAAYGIALAPEPEHLTQGDPEWAYMVTGYSECIDSFFAFGLFESGMTGAKSVGAGVDVAELMELCLAENERRMSRYDARLLRPRAMPAVVRLARRFMRGRAKPLDSRAKPSA